MRQKGEMSKTSGAIDDPRGARRAALSTTRAERSSGVGVKGESDGFGNQRGAPIGCACAFGKWGEHRASLDNARARFRRRRGSSQHSGSYPCNKRRATFSRVGGGWTFCGAHTVWPSVQSMREFAPDLGRGDVP